MLHTNTHILLPNNNIIIDGGAQARRIANVMEILSLNIVPGAVLFLVLCTMPRPPMPAYSITLQRPTNMLVAAQGACGVLAFEAQSKSIVLRRLLVALSRLQFVASIANMRLLCLALGLATIPCSSWV